jgi:hypothetical protein
MGISSMRQSDGISQEAPLGALLGDVAGHAQGIVRAEIQLAFAQVRHEVQTVARRVALQGGAIMFVLLSAIALMIAGALALSTVVVAWMAVLITAGAAMVVALVLFGLARRGSA